jgi:hypothetical protein
MTYRIEWEADGDISPFEYVDAGVVTKWTSRDKRPSEVVLAQSRYGKCLYDVALAQLASRASGATRQDAARYVNEDVRRLRAWFKSDWSYERLVIYKQEVCNLGHTHETLVASLGGIESDASEEYKASLVEELLGDLT